MDGIYQISLGTPMGMEKGSMDLHVEAGRLTGTFTIMGGRHQIRGTATDNTFTFSGDLQHMMGMVNYTINGTVEGASIRAMVKTNFGTFNMTGTKTGA